MMNQKLLSFISSACLAAFVFPSENTVLAFPSQDDDLQNDDPSRKSNIVILTKPTEYAVTEGETLSLPCSWKGDDSAVLWKRGDKILAADLTKFDVNYMTFDVDSEHNFIIKNATEAVAGEYVCQVGPNAAVTHKVFFKLDVQITYKSKILDVGSDLHLSCHVTPTYPEPTIEWFKQMGAVRTTIGQAPDLNIYNVTTSHSGTYLCSVFNSHETKPLTKSIDIRVVEGLEADSPVVYAANFQENASLCCSHDKSSKSKSTAFGWEKNGVELNLPDGHYEKTVHGKYKFCLEIRPIRDDDFATYTCTMTLQSPVSDRINVVKNNIVLSGAPLILNDVEVSVDENSKSPLLKWGVKTHSLLTSYEIYVKKQEEMDWKLYNSQSILGSGREEVIEQVFENLPNGQYNVKLVAVNKHGRGEITLTGTPVVIDKLVPEVHSAKIQGTGTASSAFPVSITLCIFSAVVATLWSYCY